MNVEHPSSELDNKRIEAMRMRAEREGVKVYDELPDGWITYEDYTFFVSPTSLVNVYKLKQSDLDQMDSIFGRHGWGLKLIGMSDGYHKSLAEVIHAPLMCSSDYSDNSIDAEDENVGVVAGSGTQISAEDVSANKATIVKDVPIVGGFGRRVLRLLDGGREQK